MDQLILPKVCSVFAEPFMFKEQLWCALGYDYYYTVSLNHVFLVATLPHFLLFLQLLFCKMQALVTTAFYNFYVSQNLSNFFAWF